MESKMELDWKKCKKCGLLQHRSHLRCLKCKNKTFEVVNPKGTCKLIAYTVLKAPPAEFREKSSYALGIVEFKNGVKALGQITTQCNLKIGMELKPVYKKLTDNLDGKEVYAYMFEPI